MCVCDRGAAAEASAKLAKAAKPKVPWIVVARKMAVEYRDDPLKYGDGSGTVSSWVAGGGTLHPSGFPESSLSQLRAACRELAQVLTANGLDAAAPAGRMAQSGPSSPEDGEPEVTGGLTPHPNSPVKAATELKDDNYRASWKFCLAEMRKELQRSYENCAAR